MPKGEWKSKKLDAIAWRVRLIKMPHNARLLEQAGLAALTAAIEPDADLKEIHGSLQFMRHWLLSEDYDLVSKAQVVDYLKNKGLRLSLKIQDGTDQDPYQYEKESRTTRAKGWKVPIRKTPDWLEGR